MERNNDMEIDVVRERTMLRERERVYNAERESVRENVNDVKKECEGETVRVNDGERV